MIVLGPEMKRRFLLCLIVGLAQLSLADCAPHFQHVRIAVQDYRFDPALVRLEASRSARLVLTNEGREAHDLASELFTLPGVRVSSNDTAHHPQSLKLLPGQSVEVTVQLPPGTYVIRCLVRGHTGMTGMLVVS